MTSEVWQFAVVIAGFFLVAVLWLCVIYLPARTMEHSESRRTEVGERDGRASG